MTTTLRLRAALRAGGLACIAALAAAGCHGSDEDALSVVISLPDQQVTGASKTTLLVDYSGAGARILAEGGSPACAFILPGIDGDFTDDRQGTLTIHASGPRASRGPADIAACRMKAGDEDATAADIAGRLSVRLQAAEDAAGKPIDLTAPSVRHAGSAGGSGPKDDRAVEEAQAAAVADAASVAASQPPKAEEAATGATGATGAGAAHGGSIVAGTGAGTASAAGGHMGGAAASAAAKPATPANIPRSPVSNPATQPAPVVDDSAQPGMDRDPGYDDSPSDDESAPAYSIDFGVQTAGKFGALQLDISHLGNSGGFIGRGDKVDCVSLVDAIVASNYAGERTTKVGLISLQGINTPNTIMRCGFRSREVVTPGSFMVQVTDASDTESKQIEPAPTVVVTSVVPRR